LTRRTLVAPLALAFAAAALAAPASSGAASGCTAGLTTIGGKKAHRFCGPATATATVGGKTLRFTGGSCLRSPLAFSVNIGTVLVGAVANPKPANVPSFGLTISPGDSGVHLGQAIGWVSGGKRYSVTNNQATLSSGRAKGSFKGTLYPGGGKVSGTFSC
jgi:hypothetical protein